MPKRTATISRSNDTRNEEDSLEEIEPTVDDNPQEEKNETMLGLDDLKSLIFLGKLNKVIDISGYKFVVTTLSTKQQKDIMKTVMKFDQLDRLLDIKPVTVSYVIESVNGVPLEDLCTDDEIEDVTERRLDVVLSMQSVVIEKVYQVYEQLVVASNEEVGLEDLKV
jgi:hypothetical protein